MSARSADRTLPFTKMHGAGNDFVVLDGLRETLPPLEPLAKRLSDRHLGIGFDQMLVVRPPSSDAGADFRMEIYNADGSQVEMCANGIRAFFKYLRDAGHTGADEVRVETPGGVVRPRWMGGDRVQVDMGPPILAPERVPTRLRPEGLRPEGLRPEGTGAGKDADPEAPALHVPLRVGDGELRVSAVSMGNPHCVLFVEDVGAAPVAELGREIEHHPAFPNRVNVEFVQLLGRDRVRQRTWERGTGETLACGSGACATAVVAMLRGLVERRVAVELRGGTLEIAWAGEDASVFMTGPAATVFRGEIPLDETPGTGAGGGAHAEHAERAERTNGRD